MYWYLPHSFLYTSSVTDSLVPMPSPFCSSVCVEYNTWKWKSGEKRGRPGNEAMAGLSVFAYLQYANMEGEVPGSLDAWRVGALIVTLLT